MQKFIYNHIITCNHTFKLVGGIGYLFLILLLTTVQIELITQFYVEYLDVHDNEHSYSWISIIITKAQRGANALNLSWV